MGEGFGSYCGEGVGVEFNDCPILNRRLLTLSGDKRKTAIPDIVLRKNL